MIGWAWILLACNRAPDGGHHVLPDGAEVVLTADGGLTLLALGPLGSPPVFSREADRSDLRAVE